MPDINLVVPPQFMSFALLQNARRKVLSGPLGNWLSLRFGRWEGLVRTCYDRQAKWFKVRPSNKVVAVKASLQC